MLRKDVAAAVGCVNHAVVVEVSQAQFDALVDFCFNVGTGSFVRSTLLRELNAGRHDAAAEQFLVWVNAGGKRCAGLVRRREAERAMFVSGLE